MSNTDSSAQHERRKAPRVESQLLVKFKAAGDPQAKWQMTPLKDMSSGGVRFIAEAPCELGALLELQLLLPTLAAPLRLTGRVVWVRPASVPQLMEYGVELTDLSPTQRADIEQLVALYRNRKRPTQ